MEWTCDRYKSQWSKEGWGENDKVNIYRGKLLYEKEKCIKQSLGKWSWLLPTMYFRWIGF